MTTLKVLGPNGMPIEKRAEPRVKKCNFCGIPHDQAGVMVVSPNGLSAICDNCIGGAIHYMRVKHNYVPDLENGCWRKIDEQRPKG